MNAPRTVGLILNGFLLLICLTLTAAVVWRMMG
jgi:hypothetical protein